MSKDCTQNFRLFVCMIALIMATISPACALNSGNTSIMEICTSFGFVTIDADGNIIEKDNSSPSQMLDICSFCLHASDLKSASTLNTGTDINTPLLQRKDHSQYGYQPPVFAFITSHTPARAPPTAPFYTVL